MTKEEMMDAVIRAYGHESAVTIAFCVIAETSDIGTVKELFKGLI